MKNLESFLKALSAILKEKGKDVIFIPRWVSVKDEKFPAYTKFTLEISELSNFEVTYKFRVQCTENTSIDINTEDIIRERMSVGMTKLMLRYYMYGEYRYGEPI